MLRSRVHRWGEGSTEEKRSTQQEIYDALVKAGSSGKEEAPLIFRGITLTTAPIDALRVIQSSVFEEGEKKGDSSTGVFCSLYPFGLPLSMPSPGRMSAEAFLLSLVSCTSPCPVRAYEVTHLGGRPDPNKPGEWIGGISVIPQNLDRNETLSIELNVLRHRVGDTFHSLNVEANKVRRMIPAALRSIVPFSDEFRSLSPIDQLSIMLGDDTGASLGARYFSMLHGAIGSSSDRWGNAERGKTRFLIGERMKVPIIATSSSVLELQKQHLSACPSINSNRLDEILWTQKDFFIHAPRSVIFRFDKVYFSEAHRPLLKDQALAYDAAKKAILSCSNSTGMKILATESTYKIAEPGINSVRIDKTFSPLSCFCYVNAAEYTFIIVGTYAMTLDEVWIFTGEMTPTGYPRPLLKGTGALPGSQSTIVTFTGVGVKGGLRRRVGTTLSGAGYTKLAEMSLATALRYSDPWSGAPYMDGVVSHGRLNAFPIQIFSPDLLSEIFNSSKAEIEKKTVLPELIALVEGKAISGDGGEKFIVSEMKSSFCRTITPEQCIGNMIFNASNSRRRTVIDRRGQGCYISKAVAEYLFRSPMYCFVTTEGKLDLHTPFYSVTHSVMPSFAKIFCFDQADRIPSEVFMGGIPGNLYTVPKCVVTTAVRSQFYEYADFEDAGRLIRALRGRLGGITVNDTAVICDTPLIRFGVEKAKELGISLTFRTLGRIYLIALWGRAVREGSTRDVKVFASRSTLNSILSPSRPYTYRGDEVYGAFRCVPADSVMDHSLIRKMYEIRESVVGD
jgi:hypothetical protein